MKKLIKSVFCLLVCFCVAVLGTVYYYNSILPDNIVIYDNESVSFNTKLEISEASQNAVDSVSGSMSPPSGDYKSNLSIMGIIPVKSVNINKVKERYVVVSGDSFGIKIFTKGVMVVGMSDVKTKDGNINPAKAAGLKIGDIILKADGKTVSSNEQLSEIFNNAKGNSIALKVQRDGKTVSADITPALSNETGSYKVGLWVRDSTAGLGTMTFYSTVNGAFAGLGHAIVDVDTGVLLPVSSGEIVKTEILSVTKSKVGSAGEICGAFTGEVEGTLIKNTDCGLFGFLDEYDTGEKLIKVAHKQEVETGRAKILTTIDNGEPKYYDCVIERVDYNNNEQKNLMVLITDGELIKKTGGIVQGMSGSPIIQNGNLVGALTNVFVNNPKKGYAVFAEEMYEEMMQSTQSLKRVS